MANAYTGSNNVNIYIDGEVNESKTSVTVASTGLTLREIVNTAYGYSEDNYIEYAYVDEGYSFEKCIYKNSSGNDITVTSWYSFNNNTVSLPESSYWAVLVYMKTPPKRFHAYNYFYIDGSFYDSVEIDESISTSSSTYTITANLPTKPSDTDTKTFDKWRSRETDDTFTYNSFGQGSFSVEITADTNPPEDFHYDAEWTRKVITVSLTGTTTSDSITVNAPTGVPNDSTFFVWQLYQGATLKVDDSTNTLGAYKFENLDRGTPYTVKFGAYTAATGGEQTAKGEQSFTTTSSNTWIYTGADNDTNGWQLATPYIYTSSGWKEAQAYVYTSSGWKQC